ncbi:MAG: hypothetical protein LBB86_01200 [Oscillospiraceae bacterium]|jgi:hypothetical protein|nr:hypothetical protein [Oscillospiraceae bacterium]
MSISDDEREKLKAEILAEIEADADAKRRCRRAFHDARTRLEKLIVQNQAGYYKIHSPRVTAENICAIAANVCGLPTAGRLREEDADALYTLFVEIKEAADRFAARRRKHD